MSEPAHHWDNNAISTCLYPFLLTLAACGKTGIKRKVQSGKSAPRVGTSALASLGPGIVDIKEMAPYFLFSSRDNYCLVKMATYLCVLIVSEACGV